MSWLLTLTLPIVLVLCSKSYMEKQRKIIPQRGHKKKDNRHGFIYAFDVSHLSWFCKYEGGETGKQRIHIILYFLLLGNLTINNTQKICKN